MSLKIKKASLPGTPIRRWPLRGTVRTEMPLDLPKLGSNPSGVGRRRPSPVTIPFEFSGLEDTWD